MNKFKNLLFVLIFAFVGNINAQTTPTGTWKTIDDVTGEAKSHLEIYEQDGKFFAKIVKLLQKPEDTVCDKCKGDKKDKPLMGMVLVDNMAPYKDYWKGGNIMDPTSGKDYGCSMWFESGKPDALMVRGKHWTGLYRTQTWHRVK